MPKTKNLYLLWIHTVRKMCLDCSCDLCFFFTLVAQSFDLQLQSKDTDLDHEENEQVKMFLRAP